MFDVDVRTNSQSEEWASALADLGGNPFHSPEVLSLEHRDRNIRFISWTSDGRIQAASVGALYTERRFGVLPVARVLYLPTAPAVRDGCDSERVYDSLINWCRGNGCDTLHIGLRWGQDFRQSPRLGKSVGRMIREFTIDLTLGMQEILGRMHKKHRKNIRQALDGSLRLEKGNSIEFLLRLRALQEFSSERNTERGNAYKVASERAFEEMHRKVYGRGLGNVYLATLDGAPVAALAYLFRGRRAVTVRSGATPRGYECAAVHVLQYELIRDLKEQDFGELNIGGVPFDASDPAHPQHGLYNFKRYFGADENVRTEVRHSVR